MTAVLASDRRHRPHACEVQARARKATLIANVLAAHGATSVDAAALPPQGRTIAAELAGVPAPSDATWHAVVGVLQAAEQGRRPAARPNVEALIR